MVSKSWIILVKSFLGNFYVHLAIFIWPHCLVPAGARLKHVKRQQLGKKQLLELVHSRLIATIQYFDVWSFAGSLLRTKQDRPLPTALMEKY